MNSVFPVQKDFIKTIVNVIRCVFLEQHKNTFEKQT